MLRFEANPLAEGACPELEEILHDPGVLFQKEVLLLLGRLAQRGDVRPGEDVLAEFVRTRLSAVEPELDAWEAEMLAEYPDPQVPPGFRPATGGAAWPGEWVRVPDRPRRDATSAR